MILRARDGTALAVRRISVADIGRLQRFNAALSEATAACFYRAPMTT